MEESKAGEVIAVYSREVSETFDQPDDQIYCLKCWQELKQYRQVEGPGESADCGGEYKWVTKSDLESQRARCTKCGESITIEPSLKI